MAIPHKDFPSWRTPWHQIQRECVVCGKPITGKVELLTAVTRSVVGGDCEQLHFYCQNPMPARHSVRVAKWVWDTLIFEAPERTEYLYYE